jgi:bifunctional DNase/RNase
MGGRASPWLVRALVLSCGVATVSELAVRRQARALERESGEERVELVVHEVARCANGQAVLVLREKGGEWRLPIPVGAAEAAALDRRLHGEKLARPRLHDVTSASIAALGGRVVRASIDAQAVDKVFLARVTVVGNGREVDLESRGPDAIALALEAGAPILVTRALLQSAGVDPTELERGEGAQKAGTGSSRHAPPAPVFPI